MCMASPLILVLSISSGRGMDPALDPLRYRDKDLIEAVAKLMGSHSKTNDVCVAFRRRRMGGVGEWMPYVWRIRFWRA